MTEPLGTFREDYVTCPYCGYKNLDSWEFSEGTHEDVECGKCERLFDLEVIVDITYTTRGKEAEA